MTTHADNQRRQDRAAEIAALAERLRGEGWDVRAYDAAVTVGRAHSAASAGKSA